MPIIVGRCTSFASGSCEKRFLARRFFARLLSFPSRSLGTREYAGAEPRGGGLFCLRHEGGAEFFCVRHGGGRTFFRCTPKKVRGRRPEGEGPKPGTGRDLGFPTPDTGLQMPDFFGLHPKKVPFFSAQKSQKSRSRGSEDGGRLHRREMSCTVDAWLSACLPLSGPICRRSRCPIGFGTMSRIS